MLVCVLLCSFTNGAIIPRAYPPSVNTSDTESLRSTYSTAMQAVISNYLSNAYFTDLVWWQHPVIGLSMADYETTFNTGEFKQTITDLLNQNNLNVNYNIDGWKDDEAWWGLFALRGYALYGNEAWKNAALAIYGDMSSAITNDVCNGGVRWWDQEPNQKNTITNTLYMSLAMKLYQLTKDEQYVGAATTMLSWWTNWALDPSGQIYDSMSAPNCIPQFKASWTYNSGPILATLVDLYNATGNTTYLDTGDKIASSAISTFSQNGIMQDSCDASGCQQDEQVFKGVLAYYLGYYYAQRPSNASIVDYLLQNYVSNIQNNMDSSQQYTFGPQWAGPYNSDVAGVKTSVCSMMVLGAGLQAKIARPAETTVTTSSTTVNAASTTAPSGSSASASASTSASTSGAGIHLASVMLSMVPLLLFLSL